MASVAARGKPHYRGNTNYPFPRKKDGPMTKKNVADLLVNVLAEAGVRQIYGVSGDSLNGITDSIRAKEPGLGDESDVGTPLARQCARARKLRRAISYSL
jgi:hypothetical protein